MTTSQESIKIELTKLAIKFKEISLRGAKPADYKEIENAFRRLNQIYPFYSDLNELSDVTISTPLDDQILIYNSTTAQWENQTPIYLTPGSDTYIHVQASPSSTWSVSHPLLKFPSVTVVDSANNKVEGEVNYINTYNLTITFSGSFSGKAYIN